MIIYLIFTGITHLIDQTLGNAAIPQYDAIGDVFYYFEMIVGYGLGLYKYFIPPFGQVVIVLIIAIKVFHFMYTLIKHIIEVIPMLNIRL